MKNSILPVFFRCVVQRKAFREITFLASGYSIGVNETKYSRMDQVKFVEYTTSKKVGVTDHITSNFLKVVLHKFYLVHSRVLCFK